MGVIVTKGEFDKWLLENVPSEGSCVVVMKEGLHPTRPVYHLITRSDDNGHPVFLIDGKFSWDMEFIFIPISDWKIIFKRVV